MPSSTSGPPASGSLPATKYAVHPRALGVPAFPESEFVQKSGAALITVRVLLHDGTTAAVTALPTKPGPSRPWVYCPFCGSPGVYKTYADGAKTPGYAHEGGRPCVPEALDRIRHRRAQESLARGLASLRARGAAVEILAPCRRHHGPFPFTLIDKGGWGTEELEAPIPRTTRRADVTAWASEGRPACLFEIFATHLVDEDKSAELNAAGHLCIELRADALIDDRGQETWAGDGPLPPALRDWMLEADPRSFRVCSDCRARCGDLPAAIALQARLPEEMRSRLAHELTKDLSLPPGDPYALLGDAISAPERLRALDSAFALRCADEAQWRQLGGLLLRALDAGENTPWKGLPLEAVLEDPFLALCIQAQRKESKPSEEPEEEREDDDDDEEPRGAFTKQHLETAERLLAISGNAPTRSRLAAYACRVLWMARRSQHTAVGEQDFVEGLAREAAVQPELAKGWLDGVTVKHPLVRRAYGKVCFQSDYLRARAIAGFERLQKVHHSKPFKEVGPPLKDSGGNLQQQQAVRLAFSKRLSVITGAAGTGKTWVLGQLLKRAFTEENRRFWLLLAPSHKALQKLRTTLNDPKLDVEFETIQRLLRRGNFAKDETGRVARPEGVILDEAGFVSEQDLFRLLDICKDVWRVALVGDSNQLPSIQPGAALRDLLSCEHTPSVELVQPVRTEGNPALHDAARAVLAGRVPKAAPGVVVREVRWADLQETALEEHARLTKEFGSHTVQIIAGLNDHVDALNISVQKRLTWQSRPMPANPRLREGDRIIATKTDRAHDLFNSDTGVLLRWDKEKFFVNVNDRVREYLRDLATDFALGYAITVHKAQGSEWDHVIVVLPVPKSRLSTRPLLYTAVTRARKSLVLVGTPGAIAAAAAANPQRVTVLGDVLRAAYASVGSPGRRRQ